VSQFGISFELMQNQWLHQLVNLDRSWSLVATASKTLLVKGNLMMALLTCDYWWTVWQPNFQLHQLLNMKLLQ